MHLIALMQTLQHREEQSGLQNHDPWRRCLTDSRNIYVSNTSVMFEGHILDNMCLTKLKTVGGTQCWLGDRDLPQTFQTHPICLLIRDLEKAVAVSASLSGATPKDPANLGEISEKFFQNRGSLPYCPEHRPPPP